MNVRALQYGIYGGLAGGVLFGFMMGVMGMLPMIGQLVGVPSATIGVLVHLFISAVIGATFAAILQWTGWRPGIGIGLAYGLLWWGLGPLTLMPLLLGMGLGVNWNAVAVSQAIPSLIGHLVFGATLAWTYAWLTSRESVNAAGGRRAGPPDANRHASAHGSPVPEGR